MAYKNDVFADFLNQAIRDMICNDFPNHCCNASSDYASSGYDYAIPVDTEEAAGAELPDFHFPEEEDDDFSDIVPFDSEYISNRDQINDLFGNQLLLNGKLTKMLIMHRLALIDLFYGTNVNRMRQFGLSEIAEQLWQLSLDAQGNHTDAELARKAINFVANTSANHQLQVDLFSKKYGYIIEGKGIKRMTAESLLSKYLFFLVDATANKMGFPIYDSIVKDLSVKIAKKLRIQKSLIKTGTMWQLCELLKAIVAELQKRDPALWNNQTALHSKFALLDYFLWRIGKVGRFNFSLLITYSELRKYSKTLRKIKALQNYKAKHKQAAKIATSKMVLELRNLPPRFLAWYNVYTKI
ncbi:MAG: hypothetical protein ACI4AN_05330 [Muribaculaceae bacterium]